MRIETRNSVYVIGATGEQITLTKLREIRPSDFAAVGEIFYGTNLSLVIGERCELRGNNDYLVISTSPVVKVSP